MNSKRRTPDTPPANNFVYIKQELDTSDGLDDTLDFSNVFPDHADVNAMPQSSQFDSRLAPPIDGTFDLIPSESQGNSALALQTNTSKREMMLPCTECKENGIRCFPMFSSMEELESHISIEHCEILLCYRCPTGCGANYHTKASMLHHYENAHLGSGNYELDKMVSAQLKIYNSIAESIYMTVSTIQSEKCSNTPFIGRQAQLNQSNNSTIPHHEILSHP
ncbi:hypothetical protein Ddc_00258 [Ditylenchus destructor]|nr:hypothetical protein Ddc_00258 [Ditylenchus destructor]